MKKKMMEEKKGRREEFKIENIPIMSLFIVNQQNLLREQKIKWTPQSYSNKDNQAAQKYSPFPLE